jgi:hypothetical protein
MSRKLAVFAAALAVSAFLVHSADAKTRRPVDPRLDTVSTVVGAGWTAGLFAINHWNWKWDAGRAGLTATSAITLTTVGCVATSPIVATAVLNRPLSYREAHILAGSCLIPIIGGWLVNEGYNNGWLWAPDEKPAHKVRYRKK